MFLSESLTGHYLNMYPDSMDAEHRARLFGVAALVWRLRFIDGRPAVSFDSVKQFGGTPARAVEQA